MSQHWYCVDSCHFSLVSLPVYVVYHSQNIICKSSILNLKSLSEFSKVSTIFKVPIYVFEYTATISPVLCMIEAIEIVKTHPHAVSEPEADMFVILHEKGQPMLPG